MFLESLWEMFHCAKIIRKIPMCRTKGNKHPTSCDLRIVGRIERLILVCQFSRPSWIHKSSNFFLQIWLLLVNRTSTINSLQTFSPARNTKITCHNKRSCVQHFPFSYQKRSNYLTGDKSSEEWCYSFLLRMAKCRFSCVQMNFNLTIAYTTYLYAASDDNTDSKTLKMKFST